MDRWVGWEFVRVCGVYVLKFQNKYTYCLLPQYSFKDLLHQAFITIKLVFKFSYSQNAETASFKSLNCSEKYNSLRGKF